MPWYLHVLIVFYTLFTLLWFIFAVANLLAFLIYASMCYLRWQTGRPFYFFWQLWEYDD